MIRGSDLELIHQATVTESRENDTTGNAQVIFDNFVFPYIGDYDTYDTFVAVTENNNATYYAFQKAVWIGIKNNVVNLTGSILRKMGADYSIRNISDNTSAWCSQGTIIKVYRVKGV